MTITAKRFFMCVALGAFAGVNEWFDMSEQTLRGALAVGLALALLVLAGTFCYQWWKGRKVRDDFSLIE